MRLLQFIKYSIQFKSENKTCRRNHTCFFSVAEHTMCNTYMKDTPFLTPVYSLSNRENGMVKSLKQFVCAEIQRIYMHSTQPSGPQLVSRTSKCKYVYVYSMMKYYSIPIYYSILASVGKSSMQLLEGCSNSPHPSHIRIWGWPSPQPGSCTGPRL